MAKNNNIDILSLTETWLDHSVADCLISIPGYQRPFKRDRQGRRGGGVAIYCANHISARRRLDLEDNYNESVWIECFLDNIKVLFGTYYRPPGQSADERNMFLSHFESSDDLANDASMDTIIITGDFNNKCTIWDDNHYASELKRRFYDIVQIKGMSQLVNQPRRVSADGLIAC